MQHASAVSNSDTHSAAPPNKRRDRSATSTGLKLIQLAHSDAPRDAVLEAATAVGDDWVASTYSLGADMGGDSFSRARDRANHPFSSSPAHRSGCRCMARMR